ncbi:MAG: CPBP family intramembrane metalloprotease [Anaerolineaceae bacterium]|nr:CPBP family intramembrane metalloprotease [Anaerolineaceae bacterium]
MNASGEELNYRAGFLSALEGPVGKQHSLWMTAAFFGIGHFYGVPDGFLGVVTASMLARILQPPVRFKQALTFQSP